jgi:plastocyanin
MLLNFAIPVLLSLLAPPPPAPLAIATQPASATVNVGDNVAFTVVPAGGTAPYRFQWNKGGAPVAGAVAPTFTLTGVLLQDAGTYEVRVFDAASVSVLSAPATLTVNPVQSPTITVQPANVTVAPGQSASFSVTARGQELLYQWYRNGVAIAGATGAAMTTGPAAPEDNGAQFSVTVYNTLARVTSANATLTVTGARGTNLRSRR